MNRYKIHEPKEPRMYLVAGVYRGQRFTLNRKKFEHLEPQYHPGPSFPEEIEIRGYTPLPAGMDPDDKSLYASSFPHFVVRSTNSWRKKKLHASYILRENYYEPI